MRAVQRVGTGFLWKCPVLNDLAGWYSLPAGLLPSHRPMPPAEVQQGGGEWHGKKGSTLGSTSAVAKSLIWVIRLGPALLKSGKPVFFPVMHRLETPTARVSSVLTKKGKETAGKCFTDGRALGISLKRGPPMQMAHYFNIWIFILLKHLFFFSPGFI